MNFPRRASARLLATLTLAALAAALPLKHAAQNAPSSAPSPNGKIVFQSTQGGDGYVNDIYVMDAEGRHQTRLTDDPGDDVSAVWSPQGDKIAFLSNRRGAGYEIFLMNADGTNQHPLRDASPVYTAGFGWSPDGTRLAFDNGGNVYVVAVDGASAPTNVSVNKDFGSSDSVPSWSPTGGRLVVRNSIPCTQGCSDLYVVNAADGTGRVKLQTGPGFDADPRWSPTADVVVYEGDRFPLGRGIYVTAADGTGSEMLVSGAAGSWGSAVWSPDGSRLGFFSQSGVAHVVKPDGTGLVSVSDAPASSLTLFWSPDGSKVGYHNANADGWVDIFVVASDGSGRRAVNYTKTRRADEFAYSWQKLTP
ncbi:MAG TPA: hypothetical protein VF659_06765 [Pyrinomonadaceae bacterium]|jgi:TolB protein